MLEHLRLEAAANSVNKAVSDLLADGGPLQLEDLASEIRVSNALMQLTVDKTTGLLQTWQVNGATVLNGGPILNFGESGPRDDHFLYSARPPRLKNPTVSAASEGKSVRINVAGDAILGNSEEPAASVSYSLLVDASAQIDFKWTLQWHSKNANARELGLKLPLPRSRRCYKTVPSGALRMRLAQRPHPPPWLPSMAWRITPPSQKCSESMPS